MLSLQSLAPSAADYIDLHVRLQWEHALADETAETADVDNHVPLDATETALCAPPSDDQSRPPLRGGARAMPDRCPLAALWVKAARPQPDYRRLGRLPGRRARADGAGALGAGRARPVGLPVAKTKAMN